MTVGTKSHTKVGKMKLLLEKDKTLNSRQIADQLGCGTAYVRAMAKRLGVTLTPTPKGRRQDGP